jgi:hypothetical protein
VPDGLRHLAKRRHHPAFPASAALPTLQAPGLTPASAEFCNYLPCLEVCGIPLTMSLGDSAYSAHGIDCQPAGKLLSRPIAATFPPRRAKWTILPAAEPLGRSFWFRLHARSGVGQKVWPSWANSG